MISNDTVRVKVTILMESVSSESSSFYMNVLLAGTGMGDTTDGFLFNGSVFGGGGMSSNFWGNVTELSQNNVSSTAAPGAARAPQQILSDEVRDVVIIVNMAVLCQTVSVAGVIVNILNICVFVRQGFGDSLNVTLAGLAVADLGIVTFAVWLCVCYNPLFNKLDLPFKPLEFVYLTAGLPRLSCARVSSWILALASLERCLCITLPLTFRSIITPRRSLAFILAVYVVMAASVLPVYYTSRLVRNFDPARNASTVSLVFTSDRFAVDNVVFGVGVFLSVASFAGVAVCTAILIWSLNEKTKWRDSNVAAAAMGGVGGALKQITTVSHRNRRVGKMVSIISVFFIVCYTPNTVNQLVMSLVKEFAKNGSEVNANQVSWSFGFLFESINATVNFAIYMKMSSRYRNTLVAMFKWKATPPDYELKTSSISSGVS